MSKEIGKAIEATLTPKVQASCAMHGLEDIESYWQENAYSSSESCFRWVVSIPYAQLPETLFGLESRLRLREQTIAWQQVEQGLKDLAKINGPALLHKKTRAVRLLIVKAKEYELSEYKMSFTSYRENLARYLGLDEHLVTLETI